MVSVAGAQHRRGLCPGAEKSRSQPAEGAARPGENACKPLTPHTRQFPARQSLGRRTLHLDKYFVVIFPIIISLDTKLHTIVILLEM